MASSNQGPPAPDSTVRVHITLEVPVEILLNPGPALYFRDEQHVSEHRRRDALPEDDNELIALVQEVLELKEAVQSGPLIHIIRSEIAWQIDRPAPEGR